jgi:hypothetical protein
VIGSVISHYRILEELVAAAGVVYRAGSWLDASRASSAWDLSHDAAAVERFLREARATSASVIQTSMDSRLRGHEGQHFLAMELLGRPQELLDGAPLTQETLTGFAIELPGARRRPRSGHRSPRHQAGPSSSPARPQDRFGLAKLSGPTEVADGTTLSIPITG